MRKTQAKEESSETIIEAIFVTKQLLIFLWAIFILASCRVGSSVIAVSTITPIPTASFTATSTITLTPTQTGTPTVSPEVMRYQCLEIVDNPPADNFLKGVIVYNGDANLYSWLSDQEANETYILPQEADDTLWQFEVSPDRQYLKYIHSSARTQEDRLVIAGSDGQPIWSQVVGSSDWDWDWFDDEHLVLSESSGNEMHEWLLLNPFNGEQKRLPADFPDSEVFSPDRWAPFWYYASPPLYDPTLTRVLYPAIEDKEKKPVIIMWDIKTNQKIAEIVTMDDWGDTPIWMSDGTQFIIATNLSSPERASTLKEFFAVSRDGEIKQLTHFGNSFSRINILDGYSLSPDEKRVAFWIFTQPSPYDGPRLAVLDIQTGEVTNYCIKGDPFADGEAEPGPPIWSPDGTQLLIVSRIPMDTKVRRVIVVDVARNYAAQIYKDMEPVGWMKAP